MCRDYLPFSFPTIDLVMYMDVKAKKRILPVLCCQFTVHLKAYALFFLFFFFWQVSRHAFRHLGMACVQIFRSKQELKQCMKLADHCLHRLYFCFQRNGYGYGK